MREASLSLILREGNSMYQNHQQGCVSEVLPL